MKVFLKNSLEILNWQSSPSYNKLEETLFPNMEGYPSQNLLLVDDNTTQKFKTLF